MFVYSLHEIKRIKCEFLFTLQWYFRFLAYLRVTSYWRVWLSKSEKGRKIGACHIYESFSLIYNTLNLALNAGSSKQGKARRASTGWNCVVASQLYFANLQ